ncbi:MAG: chromosomal replication initiator protein DnaA [Desulfobulbaceae bacterium]|nr:chromosomal replication initiator protein DnaA [Desulfobulbaceae bacterium]
MPWQKVKTILKQSVSESVYSLWIEPVNGRQVADDQLELICPDQFFASWVTDRYLSLIRESLALCGHGKLKVRCVAMAGGGRQEVQLLDAPAEQLRLPNVPERRTNVRALHPRYTFDEFMVGESNALAHSACQAVAVGDTSLGRCLYIEAGTGLGKSHLTHAVAHHVATHAPGTRLHYLTAQHLTGEMVRAIKGNAMEQFKDKYQHHCDLLLVEDVQALAGRVKTQAELANVFDVLMESGKTIVFTGGVAPRDIPDLDDSMRSRFSSGLVTSINPPDLHTRVIIIKRKAANHQLPLTDELIIFLAESIRGDVRQLESAIIGLKAKSCLHKTPPDLTMVMEVVRGIVGQRLELSAEVVRDFVARQFKVTVTDLRSKSRKKSITFPRQVGMYLARKHTEQALSDIGGAYDRDHSTVVHSVRVISEAITRNGSIRGQVEHLSDKLKKELL